MGDFPRDTGYDTRNTILIIVIGLILAFYGAASLLKLIEMFSGVKILPS